MTQRERIKNAASDPNTDQRRTGGSPNDPHGGHEHVNERPGPDPDPVDELVPGGSGAVPPSNYARMTSKETIEDGTLDQYYESKFGQKSDNHGASAQKDAIRKDARGQFAPSQADRKNSGLSSATPRAVTGNEDATVEDADKKPSPNPSFDIRTKTNKHD